LNLRPLPCAGSRCSAYCTEFARVVVSRFDLLYWSSSAPEGEENRPCHGLCSAPDSSVSEPASTPPFITHTDGAPQFPREAVSRFVQFQLTTEPGPGRGRPSQRPSSARLPTTVMARPRLGIEAFTSGVSHPDIGSRKTSGRSFCAPQASHFGPRLRALRASSWLANAAPVTEEGHADHRSRG
jgi:hypothetical protein